MNQKFIVKFEQGGLEQTYKIAEADVTDGVNSVFQLIDDDFTKVINATFAEMRKAFIAAYNRHE